MVKHTRILKSGNRIVLDPTPQSLAGRLEESLTFRTVKFLYGDNRHRRFADEDNPGPDVEQRTFNCYTYDHKQRLATSLGFYDRISRLLEANGHEVELVDLSQPPAGAKSDRFTPLWKRLYTPGGRLHLRDKSQEEFLVKFMSQLDAGLPGRFDCAPGFGKSTLIGFIGVLLPHAKIHVLSKRIPVLRERILPELRQMLPDVGMYGGGLRNLGHRVQLFSFDSLRHSDGKADILIVDESQDAAATKAAGMIARYADSVNFGFSATHDMRLDGSSMREEAMFGPVVFRVGYQQAADAGLVVPLEVRWRLVSLVHNPCAGVTDPVERKRLGIWRNLTRNELVAADARLHPDEQVLITCETLEHALALRQLLPEFTVVHSATEIPHNRRKYFAREGLWPEDAEPMTPDRLKNLTRMFERGKLRKAIVTTIWNVGVSMNHLEVVCRADASGSPIMNNQIPGRASRTNEAIGKTVGVVHDYDDGFDPGFHGKSAKRFAIYEANGWKQVMPPGAVRVRYRGKRRAG